MKNKTAVDRNKIQTQTDTPAARFEAMWTLSPSSSTQVTQSSGFSYDNTTPVTFPSQSMQTKSYNPHNVSRPDSDSLLDQNVLAQLSPKIEPIGIEPKRNQTKMLLVCLIEYFCSHYGDSPSANHKVFFLICQTLRSLGFIDAEFVDEMSSVRSTFQLAFRKLFYTAIKTVDAQTKNRLDLPHLLTLPSVDIPASVTDTISLDPLSSDPEDYFASEPHRILANEDVFYNLSVHNSRYRNDFIETSLLGKGGFASAWKARNKLDGIEYAIKKIRLGHDLEQEHGNDNPYERIFREIKNLARLEHQNVIRYYASWLEYDSMRETRTPYEETSMEGDSLWEETETHRSKSYTASAYDPSSYDESLYGLPSRNTRHASTHYDEESDMGIVFESDSNDNNGVSLSSHRTQSIESETNSSYFQPRKKKDEGSWTLFIQMQLCPTTLYDYIRQRNREWPEVPINNQRITMLFSQILHGVAYVHGQGLIHRDLKPSNIFLSASPSLSESNRNTRRLGDGSIGLLSPDQESNCTENWVPKIGDFGLAATVLNECGDDETVVLPTSIDPSPEALVTSIPEETLLAQNRTKRRPKLPQRTRTIGVGTRTYASPEQLAVPAQAYDEKVDIYSLGIILFELYVPFTTAMERASAIDRLKSGIFPTGFVEHYPKESALILWMMDKDPFHRPSAKRLLEFELFAKANTMLENLQGHCLNNSEALEAKTKEVDRLMEKVEQLELEQKKDQEVLQRMQQKMKQMQLCIEEAERQGFIVK
ncbi:kinase-like domain-containing protein [Spinellus fusiger]|nr:kinase-like domain-containing protein [Spinellus fusiger]